MAEEIKKRILIVDDSEIDREVLKMMIEENYDVDEAFNGLEALEKMVGGEVKYDAIMLDVQMPDVDGFSVLRLMRMLNMNIPVALITAEATKDNVQKAARWAVSSFISKPFHRELVLARVNNLMTHLPVAGAASAGATASSSSTEAAGSEDALMDLVKTLEDLTKNYLKVRKKNDAKYRKVSDTMEVLLEAYNKTGKGDPLTDDDIATIAKAAYFCDMGKMFLSDEMLAAADPLKFGGWQEKMIFKNHTTFGAQLVSMATDPSCEFFVEVCADMCQNHHERTDGKGYPKGIHEAEFSINAQLCGMSLELAEMAEEKGIDEAIKQMETTSGNYGLAAFDALMASHDKLAKVYAR